MKEEKVKKETKEPKKAKAKKEPIERKNFTSGEFTKSYIKNFIINSIFVGIVLGFIYAMLVVYLIGEKIPPIVATIIGFILIFVGLNKIYVSAINDALHEGKVKDTETQKVTKNIIIMFLVILVLNLVWTIGEYIITINGLHPGFKSLSLQKLIISGAANIFIYLVIAAAFRVRFLKACGNPNNIYK